MKSGIYIIKNIINNKVYVGSAVNIDKRWKEHKNHLKEGKHHSCHLQSAWNIYGEQSFKFDMIEEVSNPDHLLSYEQVYLDYYKSYEREKGYNICKTAGSQYGMKHTEEAKRKISDAVSGEKNPFSGRKHTEEAKQKISEGNKGKKLTEETKNKMREAHNKLETIEFLKNINTGKKLSEETKQKLRQIHTGKKHSEETKQKISEAHKGKVVSEEIRNKIGQANTGKKRSEETKRKMSEAGKNKPETIEHLRKINTGKKRTEETKNKISEAHRKRKNSKHYTFDKDSNKYRVRIWGNHIGYYNTEEEAKQAVIVNLEKLKVQQTV